MDTLKRIIGLLILLGVVWAGINSFFEKTDKDKHITYSTSDAKDLKGEFSIALDSWIGYFPFRSPVFGKLMRDAGYRIKIVDDKADYKERMKMLKKGSIDFAVSTVDSYLNNGSSAKFPGIIIAVIDESKGGDAIVALKNKVKNIDMLKVKRNFKIAFTPSSPSEYLLKAISVHFGVPRLKRKDDTWRVEVNGAEEAYQKIMNGEVDMASLWEPYVSKAISKPGIIKIIGSEDIEKLIVDILLVNRKYAIKNPELVKLFVKNYFETLRIYKKSKNLFFKDI